MYLKYKESIWGWQLEAVMLKALLGSSCVSLWNTMTSLKKAKGGGGGEKGYSFYNL